MISSEKRSGALVNSNRALAGLAMSGSLGGLLLLQLFVNYQIAVLDRPPVTANVPRAPSAPSVQDVEKEEAAADAAANSEPATTDKVSPAEGNGQEVASAGPTAPGAPAAPVAPLSAEEHARLAQSGCLPGAHVAPPKAATFRPKDENRDLVADIGDDLTVDPEHAATADRCFLIGKTISGEPFSGSMLLVDIAPFDKVKAQIDARGYNQMKAIALGDTYKQLVADIQVRAPSLHLEAADYDPALHQAAELIQRCAAVTYEQYRDAQRVRVGSPVDTPDNARVRTCSWDFPGTAIPGPGRDLRVELHLKTASRPYDVVVQFAFKKDVDTMFKTRTFKEGILAYYDVFGIGHYQFR